MLARDLITQIIAQIDCDAWRQVILVSPDHFHQAHPPQLLLTDEAGGQFFQDKRYREFLPALKIDILGVNNEHGITAVRQLLQEQCPSLPVVSLALQQDGTSQRLRSLGARLAEEPETLLLISSDFSHHGDLAETSQNDTASLRGLQNGELEAVVNDCPACWQVLQGFMGGAPDFRLVAHRNSYDYSGVDQDITSYITGWFYEKSSEGR